MRINRTVSYSAIQGFFWLCYAVIMGFASLYLLDAGFDNSGVGFLIAAAGLLSALLQPVVAGYADRPDSMSLKRIVVLFGWAAVAAAAGLLLSRGSGAMTWAFYAAAMVLLQVATPLVNALGVATVNGGEKMDFGIARGVGSLGYAAGAYALGALAERFGAVTVPAAMLTGFGLFLLASACYRDIPQASAASKTGAAKGGFFRRYPRYGIVLLGCGLLFVSHVVLNSFTYQIVVSRGGSSGDLGVVMALASALELPVMFAFGWMLKKARCDFWFRITGIFFMLKCLGTLLCTSIPQFYGVQIFQMFGWGLITVSAAYYVNAIMAPEDTVKGQAYYTVSLTLGNVAGAIAAGRILDAMGVDAMLIFGTVSAFAGGAIVLIFSQKTEKL